MYNSANCVCAITKVNQVTCVPLQRWEVYHEQHLFPEGGAASAA